MYKSLKQLFCTHSTVEIIRANKNSLFALNSKNRRKVAYRDIHECDNYIQCARCKKLLWFQPNYNNCVYASKEDK